MRYVGVYPRNPDEKGGKRNDEVGNLDFVVHLNIVRVKEK